MRAAASISALKNFFSCRSNDKHPPVIVVVRVQPPVPAGRSQPPQTNVTALVFLARRAIYRGFVDCELLDSFGAASALGGRLIARSIRNTTFAS